MRFSTKLLLTLAVLAGSLALAPGAAAEYGPGGEPASAVGDELGDQASTQPVISRDGRYVAFRTESSILLGPSPSPDEDFTSGIVRKDLVTGAVDLVTTPGANTGTSISADGRYILFESNRQLVPADANRRTDIYVRDMTRPATDLQAYELVSSLDGLARSPVYTSPSGGSRAGEGGFGLSADGRTAVFWTESQSNLPVGAPTTTPRSQVFVRSLDRDETRLVTRYKSDPTLPGTPVAPNLTDSPQPVISGTGNVVAWQDTNAAPQTRILPGEDRAAAHYLWRDITALPAGTTRRITGISDPDDPDCPPNAVYTPSQTATGPCYGPFASPEAQEGTSDSTPSGNPLSISHDGRRVLFISNARRRPHDAVTERQGVYLVDMTPGLSRKQATREPISLPKSISNLRGIVKAVISSDGRYVAFTSRNNAFDGPRPIGSFQGGELSATNVFVLDLEANTVERATRSPDGGDYLGRIQDPEIGTRDDTRVDNLTLTSDASTIGFQAADGNLFVGDANGVLDVQVVRRATPFRPVAITTAPPFEPVPRPPRVRPLRAVHPVIGYIRLGRGGVAILTVRVPVAGRLSARASGRRAGRRLPVASVKRRIPRPATVKLRLRPSQAVKRALKRQRRLRVAVQVRYAPRGGPPTRASRRYTLTREAVR
jgi:Tol biopolymer transport system component